MISILVDCAARSLGLGILVWIALKVLRIRSPQIQSLAWTAVLFTALSMPLLTRMMRALAIAVPEAAPVTTSPWTGALLPIAELRPLAPVTSAPTAINWASLALAIYWLVAAALLVRLLVGLLRSWRLSQRATPLGEPWCAGWDVRVSEHLHIPVTYGSTILFPANWKQWDSFTRQAVLLHEQAHVRRRDFYVNALASLHLVAFWFSPFAWWLERKLVELAEVASDDEAVRGVQDRVSYAEVLVTLAKAASKPGFAGLAMARGRTVERRVERILHESAVVPAASWMCRALVMAAFLPLAAVFGGAWLLRVQPAAAMAIPQQETLPPRIHQQASNFAPPEERRSTVHPVAAAQTPASTISGTVFDLTGAVIPGVTVALLNADGVAQGKALSNDSGAYSFGQIAAGQYTIEATIPTFATFRKAITLAESTAVRQDVILQLGRTETRLEVSASKSEPAPAPPDPTAGTAGPRVPLRIGGDVLAPTLISAVNPVYPSRPRINHVEGSVVLQFIVGVDGRVISLQVDPSSGAGNLELIKAAMDAVRQWQYRPGTQNGIPVEFPTTITVDFKLVD